MLTSSGDQDKVNAIDAGADDFIGRPFNPQELLSRVRSLLRIKEYHDTIQTQAAELADWNRMLEARVTEQLEELEKMTRLRRFLSPTLAELILTQGESILESHRREIAVLFADLRGWTNFSATTEPEEVMGVIGSFHAAMGGLILEFEATVDQVQTAGRLRAFDVAAGRSADVHPSPAGWARHRRRLCRVAGFRRSRDPFCRVGSCLRQRRRAG